MRIARNALGALLLAGALAACGGGGDRGGNSAHDAAPGAVPGAAKERTATAGRAPLPAERSVAYTARLSVRAQDANQAAAKAKQLALSAGGYVEKETSTASGGTLTLKIPSERYPAVLTELSGKLGTRLELHQEAQDITGEVADVDSRVKSAQASIASFRKLLDRAGSLSEIMSVESEISRRQADLEALQARQKALAESTRYASVTVTLTSPVKAAPEEKDEAPGFFGGLRHGWDAFTATLSVISTVVGWLLPFLVLFAVIGMPVGLLWHRLRSRQVTLPPK